MSDGWTSCGMSSKIAEAPSLSRSVVHQYADIIKARPHCMTK